MVGKKVFKWILSTSWLEGRTVLCKSGMSHRAHTQLQHRVGHAHCLNSTVCGEASAGS